MPCYDEEETAILLFLPSPPQTLHTAQIFYVLERKSHHGEESQGQVHEVSFKSVEFRKLGIKGGTCSLSKNMYKKPTAYIVLNCERLNAFPKVRNKQI